jgi:hypothetical protein
LTVVQLAVNGGQQVVISDDRNHFLTTEIANMSTEIANMSTETANMSTEIANMSAETANMSTEIKP